MGGRGGKTVGRRRNEENGGWEIKMGGEGKKLKVQGKTEGKEEERKRG